MIDHVFIDSINPYNLTWVWYMLQMNFSFIQHCTNIIYIILLFSIWGVIKKQTIWWNIKRDITLFHDSEPTVVFELLSVSSFHRLSFVPTSYTTLSSAHALISLPYLHFLIKLFTSLSNHHYWFIRILIMNNQH